MIGEKVEHFEGNGTDLSALQSHIEGYLKGEEIEGKLVKDFKSFIG